MRSRRSFGRRSCCSAAAVLALCPAPGALAQEPERCFQLPAGHYAAGVVHHLSQNAVPHRIDPAAGVCVAAARWSEVEAATQHIDRVYWKVSRPLADECEEKALAEWATREKLRFDISTAYDLKRRPAGRTLYLRSFTSEEMAVNRRKLREAPRDEACKATAIALAAQATAPSLRSCATALSL